MEFIANQEVQNQEMLVEIGSTSVQELFRDIPSTLRVGIPSEEDGWSELEVLRQLEALSHLNTYPNYDNYLGAGAYEHHVPALVEFVCGKSEFLTSYTPYQPEVSQGTLQYTFEYQSAICALTGMDAANASVYDGASACAEAVLMCLRSTKERSKVIIAETLHPSYRAVVVQYLQGQNITPIWIPANAHGQLDLACLHVHLDHNTACVLIQSPNFFGLMEQVKGIFDLSKAAGALNILCANPLSYGLFQPANELGTDIAVGDIQPFGIPLQYGGPYAGYVACTSDLVRQLPGRIVGETVDRHGNRGFVLTLQAREQHIRREKATSNVCTNQALNTLASLVAILWYGKEGLYQLALTNYQRANYLRSNLAQIPGIRLLGDSTIFNEFAIQLPKPYNHYLKAFNREKIAPGIHLGDFYPSLKNHLLIAVTETKTKEQLDHYITVMRSCCL